MFGIAVHYILFFISLLFWKSLTLVFWVIDVHLSCLNYDLNSTLISFFALLENCDIGVSCHPCLFLMFGLSFHVFSDKFLLSAEKMSIPFWLLVFFSSSRWVNKFKSFSMFRLGAFEKLVQYTFESLKLVSRSAPDFNSLCNILVLVWKIITIVFGVLDDSISCSAYGFKFLRVLIHCSSKKLWHCSFGQKKSNQLVNSLSSSEKLRHGQFDFLMHFFCFLFCSSGKLWH